MPPLAIIAGLAIVGAAAGYAAAQSGKNENDYKPDDDVPEAGGGLDPTLAFEQAKQREEMAGYAQNRAALQMDNALGNESRARQLAALGLIEQAANGQTPSVAELQMQRGLDQAIANQATLAASARGQSALALAQQNAAANAGAMSQDVASQQGILRAQEMDAARARYMDGASGIRGFDEQRAQQQAQLDAQNRSANDAYVLGLLGQSQGALQTGYNAQLGQSAQAIDIWAAQDAQSRYVAEQERARKQQNFNDVLGGAQAGASMGASMVTGGASGAAQGAAGSSSGSSGGGKP